MHRVMLTYSAFCNAGSYPFISQTMFQGFSCRQLDIDESYLDVGERYTPTTVALFFVESDNRLLPWIHADFQISCESDEFITFSIFAFIGVCMYPIGIPILTLLTLLKNGKDIRGGGDAFEKYGFLVADYKPEFYFWDTLEMLRKACITGLIMFVR